MSSRVEEFTVSTEPELAIWQSSGTIKVVGADPGTIGVLLHGGGAEKVPIQQYGDRIEVGTEGKVRGSYTTVLSVPPDTRLSVATASANFNATSPLGALDLRSASSKVVVKEVAGDTSIKVASGDVSIEKVSGRLRVASASGDVRVGLTEGDCSCSSASGDVAIDQATDCVEMKTASGDLVVRRMTGAELQAKSMSGDVEVGIPTGTRVEVDLKTTSGRVVLPDKSTQVAEQESGDPTRRVKVATKSLSGDITIRRS